MPIERVSIANTTTDVSGDYRSPLPTTAPSHHTYVVRRSGRTTYVLCRALRFSVTYVITPTTITATASPRQQVVGRERHELPVACWQTTPPVAYSPVTLYNADDIIERDSRSHHGDRRLRRLPITLPTLPPATYLRGAAPPAAPRTTPQ